MTKNEKIIDKIKKLLELANNNTSEAEAESAMLMAQRLMVEHDVTVEYTGEEAISYSSEVAHTKWNMGFRKPLAQVISDNFRCRIYLSGGSIVFMGRSCDAKIAKDVFEYAYDYAYKEGNRAYNKAYSMGKRTKGVFNSYTLGFIAGIKEKFGEQSSALMVVTPKDVHEKYEEMSKGWGRSSGGVRTNGINSEVYAEGKQGGRTAVSGRQIEA